MRKSCGQCGNEAAAAVCWLVSTVGRSPRVQKCSKGTALCASCLERLWVAEYSAVAPTLRQRLSEAYTAVLGHLSGPSDSMSVAKTHEGGD